MPRAILLVDHGSRRPEVNAALECVGRLVAWAAGGEVIVRTAHLELAPPTVAEGLAACVAAGATEVVVHPYLLGAGRHALVDLPRRVDEAGAEFPGLALRVTAPLGVHPDLAAIVLERCGVPVVRRATLPGFVCRGDADACAAPWCGARE